MTIAMFPYAVWQSGTNQNSIPANDNSLRSEIIARGALGVADAAPSSPADGDVHIVGTAWGSFATDDVVLYRAGTWYGFAPFVGWIKYRADAQGGYVYDEGWQEFSGNGGGARNSVTALTIASGVVNVDCAVGDYFTLALTANVTSLNFSNVPEAGQGLSLMLEITQDASPRTFAWPSAFRWEGAAPAVSTGAGAVDLLAITTFNKAGALKWDATLSKGRA